MQAKTRREKMFALVEKWKATGKSQKQFSVDHGIKYSTFLYWTKKYRQSTANNPNNGFLPLEVLSSNEHHNSTEHDLQPKVEVEFSSGITLRIY
jgi:hypothetical protein